MTLNVFAGNKLPQGLNDTFLVLIPKVENLRLVSQLRPIDLCHVTYKVIAKAIMNRPKPLLDKIIGLNQAGFVLNRQITDNTIIVQEMMHSM